MEKIKSWCNDCEKDTNHQVLFKHRVDTETLEDNVTEYEEYCVVICLGCDDVTFLRLTYGPELNENGSFYVSQRTYPSWCYEEEYEEALYLNESEVKILPRIIRNLYREVVEAMEQEIHTLTAIGLGTIVEAICLDQKMTGRNLKLKIDALAKEGFVALKSLDILHQLRVVRNESAHEMMKPTKKTLETALHIVNHTLKTIYVLPRHGKKLAK